MTMIATTRNYDVPFLMSDLLISSKNQGTSIQLPTNNINISQYLKSDLTYRPETLNRKLYIIEKSVCLLVAGKLAELIPFLQELRTRCSYYGEHKVRHEHIHQFLEDYDIYDNLKESSFLISVVEYNEDDSLFFNQFTRGKWAILEDPNFQTVSACGSGRLEFINHFKQPQTITSSHRKGDIARAMQLNLTVVSKLLAVERTTLHNLNTSWGGGFEIAFYNGHEFERVDNVVYVLWHGQFNKDGDIGLPNPRAFLHYRYIEDVLYITSIEINKGKVYRGVNTIEFYSESFVINLFVVPGIDRTKLFEQDEFPKDLSFETFIISQGFSIISPTNGVFVPSLYTRSPDVSVEYKHGKSISFKIHSDLTEMIRSSAKEVWPNFGM